MPNPYYPPGVTGLEPQIAGYPPCVNCGHDEEEHDTLDERSYLLCGVEGCKCPFYDQYPPERDPDWKHDRRFD